MLKIVSALFLSMFILASSAFAEIYKVGAIEIGSRGVKCVAFDVNQKADGEFEVVKKTYNGYNNVSVMANLQDGNMQNQNIDDAVKAVQGFKAKLDSMNVSKMVIAASSGVGMAKNKDVLKQRLDTATNTDTLFLTSAEEGYYTLISSVGMSKLTSSVLLDVGSGNARISYLQDKSIDSIRNIDIPFGAITLRDAAKRDGGSYAKAVDNIIQTKVVPLINEQKAKNPGVANPFRKVVIVGGSAWAMSSLIAYNANDKAYIKYKYSDLQKFVKDLSAKGEITYPNNPPESAMANLSRVADTVTPEDLISGSSLMSGMLSTIGVRDNREISFPTESGWTSGYLIYNLSK